jgi:hypothetical protein
VPYPIQSIANLFDFLQAVHVACFSRWNVSYQQLVTVVDLSS